MEGGEETNKRMEGGEETKDGSKSKGWLEIVSSKQLYKVTYINICQIFVYMSDRSIKSLKFEFKTTSVFRSTLSVRFQKCLCLYTNSDPNKYCI